MSAHPAGSCPACEFRNAGPGRPVAQPGGLMKCAACGGEWRELGGAGMAAAAARPVAAGIGRRRSARPAPARSLTLSAVRPSAPYETGKAEEKRGFKSPDTFIWLSAALAIFFLVAQPFSFFGPSGWSPVAQWRAKPVEISALSASQLVRDGQVAVKIEGRITNRTNSRQPVGEVDVVVKQAQGHRVYSWRHRPAIAWLEPGQSIRFSTANGNVPQTGARVEIRSAGASAAVQL